MLTTPASRESVPRGSSKTIVGGVLHGDAKSVVTIYGRPGTVPGL